MYTHVYVVSCKRTQGLVARFDYAAGCFAFLQLMKSLKSLSRALKILSEFKEAWERTRWAPTSWGVVQ